MFVRQVSHKTHAMKMNGKARWVIGHHITPMDVTGDYDMVVGRTPGKVQGPPPHYHKGLHEVFVVIEGELDFLVDGDLQKLRAGDSVNLSPNTMHTFSNNSDAECKWLNIHSPKGFYSFFEEMGVPDSEQNAMAKSVDGAIIQKVMAQAADFDMHIQGS